MDIGITWIAMSLKNLIIVFILITNSPFAMAGLIEADIYGDGTNKGFTITGSNLQWMDFGITNNQSFDYISSQLEQGGIYEGWSIPTINQVINLYQSISNPFLSDTRVTIRVFENDSYNGNRWYTGSTGNIFDNIFEIVGYNTDELVPGTSTNDWNLTKSIGIIGGTDGLSYFSFTNHNGIRSNAIFCDCIEIDDRVDRTASVALLTNSATSTMLVRSIPVPEPSSVSIFLISMITLIRRYKFHP
ncbi:hypothetical protein [Alteromonas sp. CYL-A6]|uniref:hypothetical protein n=1 Tax=Alteromonas nitratireducens TaxID=3390813 RepID=UPI0034B9EA99